MGHAEHLVVDVLGGFWICGVIVERAFWFWDEVIKDSNWWKRRRGGA